MLLLTPANMALLHTHPEAADLLPRSEGSTSAGQSPPDPADVQLSDAELALRFGTDPYTTMRELDRARATNIGE